MTTPLLLQRPLREQAAGLRNGTLSATKLAEAANEAHRTRGTYDNAYLTWQGEAALAFAQATDAVIARGGDSGPLMGIPVSVKDLYAVPGLPTYAGSSQRLPANWEQPGPLMSVLLAQLPSLMGKTHTVEFAFGGLGSNAPVRATSRIAQGADNTTKRPRATPGTARIKCHVQDTPKRPSRTNYNDVIISV